MHVTLVVALVLAGLFSALVGSVFAWLLIRDRQQECSCCRLHPMTRFIRLPPDPSAGPPPPPYGADTIEQRLPSAGRGMPG